MELIFKLRRLGKGFREWFRKYRCLSSAGIPLALVLAMPMLAVDASSSYGHQQSPLPHLLQVWKAQRSEIATAYIKARVIRMSNGLRPLKPAQVAQILRAVEAADDEEALRKASQKLIVGASDSDTLWTTFEYYFDGGKVKEDDLAVAGDEVVDDGRERIVFNRANRQILIEALGVSRRYIGSLEDFRKIPDAEASKRFVVVAATPNDVTLKEGNTQVLVDTTTGLIRSAFATASNGRVIKQLFQDRIVEYPGNIYFPSLSLEASYGVDETLATLQIYSIIDAKFNIELKGDSFAVNAPGGITVIDQRETRKAHVIQLSEPTPDVMMYVEKTLKERFGSRAKMSTNAWALGAIVAVAVIATIVWIVLRNKARRPA
jgi:hypothetical protein